MFTFFRWLLVFLFLAFIFSQMIWPTLCRRPLFPMFRRESELKEKLAEARQVQYERKLEEEIATTLNPQKGEEQ
jgi:hypothetical protein